MSQYDCREAEDDFGSDKRQVTQPTFCGNCKHPAHSGPCPVLHIYDRPGGYPGNQQCLCGHPLIQQTITVTPDPRDEQISALQAEIKRLQTEVGQQTLGIAPVLIERDSLKRHLDAIAEALGLDEPAREALEDACGACSVCEEEDVRVFLFPCGHWACEGCYTNRACDNCAPDSQEGISEREHKIRILASAGKFPISAIDTLYLIGVIDVIRGDRNRLRDAANGSFSKDGSWTYLPDQLPEMVTALMRENEALRQAIREHHCIECSNTGKVLDRMAWKDTPENYHECEACKGLRAAREALDSEIKEKG